jgi:hypothetical protein
LCRENGPGLYCRHVVPEHGYHDSIIGRHAARRLSIILEHLERTAE